MRSRKKSKCFTLSTAALIVSAFCALTVAFLTIIPRLLAVSHPCGKGILIVEAWISPQAVVESSRTFSLGDYERLVVVGSVNEVENTAIILSHADQAADRLGHANFDSARLIKVKVPGSSNRTLLNAEYVEQWLVHSGLTVGCVDVFTSKFHARKSWIVYRYVFGNGYRVGVIAGPSAQSSWGRKAYLLARNLVGCLYYELYILVDRLFGPFRDSSGSLATEEMAQRTS